MIDDKKNSFHQLCESSGTFDEKQLVEIYKGLEILPLEQVEIYACKDYEWGQMQEIRLGLETLPVSLVMEYVDSKKSRELMAYTRIKAQNKYFEKIVGCNYVYYYDFQIVQILKAIKTLPVEMALTVVNPKFSPLDIEQERKKLEKTLLSQMFMMSFDKEEYLMNMVNGCSGEELETLLDYIKVRKDFISENDIERKVLQKCIK